MIRKHVVIAVLMAVSIGIPAQAALVNNGGFDINAADWNATGGGAPWAPAHVATGGNPGGYLTLSANTGAWSVWYQVINEDLDVWGIPAGTTITVSTDMKDLGTFGNNTQSGLKLESWSSALLGEFAVEFTITSSWETYSFGYTIDPAAESVKFVFTNVNDNGLGTAVYGFDNAAITIPGGTPALKPVPIVGGGMSPSEDVLSWTNPDPNSPGDIITADVFILESDEILTSEPNLGPDVLDPGVFQAAYDTTAESVDLSDAGFTVHSNKYYYWAVHVTDPEIGVIKGFTWNFQTLNAPPTNVSAGADQYLWLTMDDGTPADGKVTFTLTGTYTDDGVGTVTTEWTEGDHETDPATEVIINSPSSPITQVTIDNTGWFFFTFTVTDAVGSGSDTVNVGVYASACEAAQQDPDDIPASYPAGHGDVDNDCDVDMDDLAIMAASWIDCMSDKLGCTP